MPYGLNQFDQLSIMLVEQGYAVWNIEYRRVGETGGHLALWMALKTKP